MSKFSLEIFKNLCSSEWLPVFEIHIKAIHVKQKERIFSEGEAVTGIYFIENGKVKILSRFNNKEEKIIRISGDGMIVGHRGINAKRYPISAVALTSTNLVFIPIDIFVKLIKANPEMAVYLINFMSDELRESEERMKNLLIYDPKVRIAVILVKLIDSFGYNPIAKSKLAFTLSRRDIANMAGTTYETVIRTLSLLKDIGLIGFDGKEIEIVNEKKLKTLSVSAVKRERLSSK